MVDKHTQSFFGQSTGITVLSSSKRNPYIYFKCIQKKLDGYWEKPSAGEGKTIKCNLDEIIMVLQVLKKNEKVWSSFHNFKNSKTQISFKWDEKDENKLRIMIGKYSKVLNFSQVELLRLLLKHILKEKIRYATSPSLIGEKKVLKNNVNKYGDKYSIKPKYKQSTIEKKEVNNAKQTQIEGIIKSSTDKAILIYFNNDKEIWIPKSTIKSKYNLEVGTHQTFLIDEWILRKNSLNNN